MASQGPLDGRVSVVGGRATLNREVLERVIPSGITYSWELQLRWRIRRPHGADVDGTQASGCRRRSPLTVHLKPYWGKPAVRNFRGGRGNPKLNRARRAPLPYSALVITEAELTSKLLEVLTGGRRLVPLAMRGLNQVPRRLVRAGLPDHCREHLPQA